MKTTIFIETDSPEKLALLIKIAKEMGITVEPQYPVDEVSVFSEPSLAEAWNSKEDERWDELYDKEKRGKKPYGKK